MSRMRPRVCKEFVRPSLTRQAHKQECDINAIVKRFAKLDPHFLDRMPIHGNGQYGDFSEVVDYRSALDNVIAANEAFEALPALVRKRFGNDPAFFLDFCQDEKNLPELRAMGLAREPVTENSGADPVSA